MNTPMTIEQRKPAVASSDLLDRIALACANVIDHDCGAELNAVRIKPVLASFAALMDESLNVLTDVSQLLDGWHSDGTAWSEWDESVRGRVSHLQKRFYELDKPFARDKTPDEEMGMKWWNGMNETERAEVLRQAHEIIPNPSVADAWKLWRVNRVHAGVNSSALTMY